jgi:hypothetical protein
MPKRRNKQGPVLLSGCWRGGHPENRRAGWCLEFPYDEAWKETLKKIVPARDRAWHGADEDDPRKYWWISEGYEEQLEKLFPNFALYLRQTRLDGF